MGQKKYTIRDAEIVKAWNSDRKNTYETLSARFKCTPKAISRVLENARKKKLEVRLGKEPRAPRRNVSVRHYGVLNTETNMLRRRIRKTCSSRSSREWNKLFHNDHRLCRWPSGDLLDGDLRFCKRTREDADSVPLGLDVLPYCRGHRNKARSAGNHMADAEAGRRNRAQHERELELA